MAKNDKKSYVLKTVYFHEPTSVFDVGVVSSISDGQSGVGLEIDGAEIRIKSQYKPWVYVTSIHAVKMVRLDPLS